MANSIQDNFLQSTDKLFRYYKSLGEQAIAQVTDDQLHDTPGAGRNSIATIVKHLHGNMRSRWTNFLSEDGEKNWRKRDEEFQDTLATRNEVLAAWEEGWSCLFDALGILTPAHLNRIIYIRNEGHTVLEAIHRQLAHYSYHCGQIVLLAKQHCGERWSFLSIPPGGSNTFNKKKFEQPKSRRHFL